MNEINKRLDEILESSIIIDTLSHGPLLWSDDLIKANDEMLAREMNPWDVIPILVLQFAKNVVNNDEYFSKYDEAWKESGVSCVSWTLGPLYSKPYSFDGVFHNFSFMTYILDNRPDLFIKVL